MLWRDRRSSRPARCSCGRRAPGKVRAVDRPVVHGLQASHGQRQMIVDGELGDGLVLDAVRPPPQHLPYSEVGQVIGGRLGQEDDIALLDSAALAICDAARPGPPADYQRSRTARRSPRRERRAGELQGRSGQGALDWIGSWYSSGLRDRAAHTEAQFLQRGPSISGLAPGRRRITSICAAKKVVTLSSAGYMTLR